MSLGLWNRKPTLCGQLTSNRKRRVKDWSIHVCQVSSSKLTNQVSLHLPGKEYVMGWRESRSAALTELFPHGGQNIRCTLLRFERWLCSVSCTVSWQTWSWRHWAFAALLEVPVPHQWLPGYREAGSGTCILPKQIKQAQCGPGGGFLIPRCIIVKWFSSGATLVMLPPVA